MGGNVRDAIVFEGFDEAVEKVHNWLKAVSQSTEGEGEMKVTLCQVAKGGTEDVHSDIYDFQQDLKDFAKELIEAAAADAEEIGRGRIKYSVQVDGIKGRICFALKIPVRSDSEDDFEDYDDVPNRKGLITQQMRHTEQMTKLLVGTVKEQSDLMLRQLRDKDARIHQLERGQVETIKAFEELVSMRHVRDIEVQKYQRAEHRKDQVSHVLVNAVPALAAKLMGGGSKEAVENFGGRTPLEQMLEGLLMTFKPDQLNKLAHSDLLDIPQKATLMEMIRYVMDRQQAEQEETRRRAEAGRGGAPKPSGPSPSPQPQPEVQYGAPATSAAE